MPSLVGPVASSGVAATASQTGFGSVSSVTLTVSTIGTSALFNGHKTDCLGVTATTGGGVQFVGEDRIGHTPRDERINIHIGNAFDVVSERKQTDFRRVSSLVHEVEFEITLRNHKDMPITVEVNEPIGGDWDMLSASHRWMQPSAWAASVDVPVDAGGEAVLRYRVRVRW